MIELLRRVFAKRRRKGDDSSDSYDWDLSPDDRIGELPRRSRGRAIVRWSVVLAGIGGGGYATYQDPTILARSWSAVSPLASKLMAAADFGSAAPSRPAYPPPPKLTEASLPRAEEPRPPTDTTPRLAASAPAAAPATVAQLPAHETSVDLPARTAPASSSPVQASIPYAPPEKVTVDDPFEAKAKSSGLHPDLSRALLKELSDTDFRNARIAVEIAFARTADDGVLRWPRKREAGLAMFEVRFVPGASDNCRRYVVRIEKNRWLTTSQPVDKCGMAPVRRQAEAGSR